MPRRPYAFVPERKTARPLRTAAKLEERPDVQAMLQIFSAHGRPINVAQVNSYLRVSDNGRSRNVRECGFVLGRLRDRDHLWVVLTIHDIPDLPLPPNTRWLSDYEMEYQLPYGARFSNMDERRQAKKEGRVPKSRWVGLLVTGTPSKDDEEWENMIGLSKMTKLGVKK